MASHAAARIDPVPSHPARMKPKHWVLLVLGVLLSTFGLGLAIGGAVTLGADAAQRDGRYLVGDAERYRSTGYALTSPSVVLDAGSEGMPAISQHGDSASIHVRVANVVRDQEIFVGIAEVSDIESYLQDLARSTLGEDTWSSADPWQGRLSWLKDNERTMGPGGHERRRRRAGVGGPAGRCPF